MSTFIVPFHLYQAFFVYIHWLNFIDFNIYLKVILKKKFDDIIGNHHIS